MTIHTGEKQFLCDVCSKGFRTKKHLKQHKISHVAIRDVACDECGDMFKCNRDLSRHKKRIHTTVKKLHSCSDCGKTFVDPYKMKEHKRIHSGETPYNCGECGEAFRTWQILNRHKTKHKQQFH